MELIVSTSLSSGAVTPQRVDDSASRQRESSVARADGGPARKEKEPDAIEVNRAAERLTETLQEFNQGLSISVHQDTGRMVVQVTDPTGKVVRQMPPEKLLEAEANIDKIVGLFVNDAV